MKIQNKINIDEQKELEIKILDFFVEICNQNNLTYFLAGGTLLGAIRHKGFIPWDDDVDVMMPREDYEKLLTIFPSHLYYKLLHFGNTHNYPKAFGTINDSRTFKPEDNIRMKCRHILGVNIDIFPIDNLPNNKDEIHQYFQEVSKMAHKVFCITYSYGKGKNLWLSIKKIVGIFIYRLLEFVGIISIDEMINEYNILAQRYNGKETRMCGVTCSYIYGEGEANVKDDYFPAKRAPFEKKEYNIPANYDSYLRGLYGDYMQLPPIEKRVAHHATCYWKEIDDIEK